VGDLASHKFQATPWGFMVKQDARHGKEIIALTIVDRDPVPIDFGDTVRATGIKRRGLLLRHLLHLAEHLAAAGLVKARLRHSHAHGVEHPRDPDGRELGREHGLVPGGRHKRLGSEVIDLIRLILAQNVEQRDLIEQVTVHERDTVHDGTDPAQVGHAGAPHHADDVVTLFQQELGKIGTVLPGDSRDECAFGHQALLCGFMEATRAVRARQ